MIKIQEKSFSPLDAHTYSVNYVEFSPCGSMLASCSLDGTTLIWNTEVTTVSSRIASFLIFFIYDNFLLTDWRSSEILFCQFWDRHPRVSMVA